ncbi:MAG TPA: outer membrane beta-barrel protein [Xanthobacteraceae bacterium]|jgi:opacity protein-like surface antigen|nr:outer membrane beta-barrel protein [Xanthobacteraceae bacterium]
MVSVKLLVGTATAAILSTAAFAADMPQQPPPQPIYQPMPMVVEQPMGAWYLRGYVGVGMTDDVDFQYIQNPANSSNFAIQHASMGDTTFFGGGIGYEFNNWLRFDVTAEYRSKAGINAFGTYTFGGGTFGDQYTAALKSTVFLANAYIDLGTWNCVTPFVGFGIGGAYNTFADLVDLGVGTSGNGIGTNASQLNFAWALHAGIAYNVTQNFSFEFAYRYLNYGSVSDQIFCSGGCNPDTYKLNNLTSNDFMLGARWRFPIESRPVVVAQPAPVMLQQSYPVMPQPAPVYSPPPLQQPAPVMVPQYQPQYQPQYPLSTRG